ncbi:leucine/isoleucine/valine transporter permease subunit [Devosia equisanguinis]|uniref:Leucine/isoleucine/valine transporter permease subunit n=1 Tax=Devosia equisanguinis TaxID=2490941 RepID=A0A447I8G2_9HYPH|nr:branched-chain amino acid ABC transporter permease [Devosia equisanguinis]VDS03811.1 leucine/isoleucine/valine transporter permease subunit [Devosia equisanguinis]
MSQPIPTAAPEPVAGGYTVRVATRTSRIFTVIALALVAVLVFAPAFASRPMLQDLILVFLLASLALCWNLMAGYAGLISVGQQAFVGLGGYALFALIIVGGFDPLLSIPVAAIIVALLSIPVGSLVFRMQGAYFAVVTWVVAEVFRLLLAQWRELGGGTGTSLPRSATGDMFGLEFVSELFGVRSAAAREIIIYWAALFTIVLVVGGCYYLLRSRVGLALRAIKDGEVAAQSVGVSTTRIKFAIYVFAAFCAGLVGAIYFLQTSRISPDAAFSLLDWTAYIIFIVVIGGLATIEGPIIGAILFVLLRNALSGYGPWYLIVLGALGIAVMLLAPKGIWGNFSQFTGIHLFPTRRRLDIGSAKEQKK